MYFIEANHAKLTGAAAQSILLPHKTVTSRWLRVSSTTKSLISKENSWFLFNESLLYALGEERNVNDIERNEYQCH